MTMQEKFDALSPEQREKLSTVKTEQELDAFLAEAGIEPTAEERAMLSEHLKAKNAPRELSDEEVGQAAGGKGWKKCPKGHWESTGFANVFGPCHDCFYCDCFSDRKENTKKGNINVYYKCTFFGREIFGGTIIS